MHKRLLLDADHQARYLGWSCSQVQCLGMFECQAIYCCSRKHRLNMHNFTMQVADIKRANGLLSDTAMFAKDCLLIPTRSMPIG